MLGNYDTCYVCGKKQTEIHHIYFGSNRRISDKYGFTVRLCPEHHRGTNGVHGMNGHSLDMRLKMEQQEQYELNKSREDFIKLIGRSYL